LRKELKSEQHINLDKIRGVKQIEYDEDQVKLLLEKIIQKIPSKEEKPLSDSEIKALKIDVKDLMLGIRGDPRESSKIDTEECKSWNLKVLEDSLPDWKIRDLKLLQKILKFLDDHDMDRLKRNDVIIEM